VRFASWILFFSLFGEVEFDWFGYFLLVVALLVALHISFTDKFVVLGFVCLSISNKLAERPLFSFHPQTKR